MTREAFEAALDAGLLETRVKRAQGDFWYRCRRNGRTQRWKSDAARISIPVKFGFRNTLRVNESHFDSGAVDQWFRIDNWRTE